MKKQIKIKQTKSNIFFVILGRLITGLLIYSSSIAFCIWAFNQITICK